MKTLNRKRFLTLGAIAAGFISLFSFCFGSWTFVQDKDVGFGFQSSSAEPVAYIEKNNKTTYYTTIEKALSSAVSSDKDVVYVIPGSVCEIKEPCTIKTDTSLVLPYGDKTSKTTNNGINDTLSVSDFSDSKNENNLGTNVKLKTTLTVNGTLEIGGEVGGGGNLGLVVGGKYSQITMVGSAKIENYKTINCYGYIKEENTSLGEPIINNYDGSNFYMPMAIYDWNGGSYAYACNQAKVLPINMFDFPNVKPKIVYNYGCLLEVNVRMYMQDAWRNVERTKMIGKLEDNNAFFMLSSGASITLKYQGRANGLTTNDGKINSKQNDLNVTKVEVCGNVKLGSLVMSMDLGIMDASINTSEVFCPISYKLDISVMSGSILTFAQKVKFLAGSKMIIQNGAEVIFEQPTIFYRENQSLKKTKYNQYPAFLTSSSLVNDGKLILKNGFAGFIQTDSTNATIQTESNYSGSIDSKEANDFTTKSVFGIDIKIPNAADCYTISGKASVNHLNRIHDDSFSEEYDALSIGTYNSLERSNNFGFITDSTLYDVKYTHLATSSFDSNLCDMSKNPNEFNRKTNQTLSMPTYKDNLFVSFGFYYDEAKTQPLTTLNNDAFNHLDGNFDLKLYIDWQEKLCNIKYSYKNSKGADCTSDALATVNGYKVANPADLSDYSIVHDKVAKQEYIFNGWKLKKNDGTLCDQTFTNEEIVDAETLKSYIIDGTATFEAQYERKNYVWVQVNQVTFGFGYKVIENITVGGGSSDLSSQYVLSGSTISISVTKETGLKKRDPHVIVTINGSETRINKGTSQSFTIQPDWANGENGPIIIQAYEK